MPLFLWKAPFRMVHLNEIARNCVNMKYCSFNYSHFRFVSSFKEESWQSIFSRIRFFVEWGEKRLLLDNSRDRLEHLRMKSEEQSFWDNSVFAQQSMKDKSILEFRVGAVDSFRDEFQNLKELYELGRLENDSKLLEDCLAHAEDLLRRVLLMQIKMLLSSPLDSSSVFLEVYPGAGGDDSCDWAAMLVAMYEKWAVLQGFKVEIVSFEPRDVGISSASLRIDPGQSECDSVCRFPYGWTKLEAGVHRLIRVSPFDSKSRRHTSFASVAVFPIIQDFSDQIKIDPSDIRIDTFRASGAGGQHVNTTDSAVRITHIPTGIVVKCQNDRSQHRNRSVALDMLKARLQNFEKQKRQSQRDSVIDSLADGSWGNQIRSYVFHPYQNVKDHRTGHEISDVNAVLQGRALHCFMEAALIAEINT